MSRVCEISGKNVMSGNNVSHAKNKTKRKFLPNLQNVKFFSKSLDKFISMKVSVRALKSVEKNGGLDDYLSKTSNRVLAPQAIAIKKSIQKNLKKEVSSSWYHSSLNKSASCSVTAPPNCSASVRVTALS